MAIWGWTVTKGPTFLHMKAWQFKFNHWDSVLDKNHVHELVSVFEGGYGPGTDHPFHFAHYPETP